MNTAHMPAFTAEEVNAMRGKKILFANFPADGHFNPLTGLAMHLKSQGNDVRWYTSATYAKKLETLQIPHYPFQHALEIPNNKFDEVFPERQKIKSQTKKLIFDIIHCFILRSPEYYHDLVDIRRHFHFDIVICDVMFSGIPFISEKMKLPVISIGVAPLMASSKDLPPNGLGLTPVYSIAGRIKQSLLRFVADHIIFRKANITMKRLLSKHGIIQSGFNAFDVLVQKSDLVLQIGSPGFEYRRSDLGKNIRFAGAILPYRKLSNREPWQHEKLARYQKVILATQGTAERDSKKLLVPVLEAFQNTEYLVVVTTGGNDTEILRQQYNADNIIIEDFIPFDDILPYANVYITNGGYGGVMLSIENEVPMIVAGVHEGKNEINARIGYFKLGINLKTEYPTATQLRKAVAIVRNNSVYYDNVRILGEELHTYNSHQIFTDSIREVLAKRPTRKLRFAELPVLVN
jgi:MGT family glycosyltransferase